MIESRMNDKLYMCRLCGKLFSYNEMSEEHYPAKSTGNDDIVQLDLSCYLESLVDENTYIEIDTRMNKGEKFEHIIDDIFDNRLSKPAFPKGRTNRSLCINCNSFLGKYDEAYLKFFNAKGNPKVIKGFQISTKVKIIKSIFGKFLSLPEASNELFDFIEFIKNEDVKDYKGKWNLYFLRRDSSTDFIGLKSIETGKLIFDEGVVYEFSDDCFIFDLLNFNKHEIYKMTNIFDILNKDYRLVIGVGEDGGYHAQILMQNLFSNYFND